MGYYDLRMLHGSKQLPDVRIAWVPYCSHPPVGAAIGEWRIVEILENDTPEVYRVRVEPIVPEGRKILRAKHPQKRKGISR